MTYETLLVDQSDGIWRVTLNRPERANTISHQLASDMLDLTAKSNADPSCRVITITGQGRHFCGGADLKEARGPQNKGSPPAAFMDALATCRVPTIAAINGAAMGGGYEIALACDIRILADTAKIGLPEIQFGGLPAGGGTQRLPRLVGPAIAKQVILTGLHLDAATALKLGMVNEVVPAAALAAHVEALARLIASRAPFAAAAAKMLINQGLDMELAPALGLERKTIREMATPEMMRAAQAEAAASQATYARIFDRQS